MNHENLRRSAQHRRALTARQGILDSPLIRPDAKDEDKDKDDPIVTPPRARPTRIITTEETTAAITTRIVRPPVRTTRTPTLPVTPITVRPTPTPILPIPRPVPSTSLTPNVPATTSSRPPILLTTSSPATTTLNRSTPITTVRSTITPNIKPSPSPSPSSTETAPASGSVSTGALVGGIGGGIVAVGAIAFVAVFLIRRWRKKAADRDAFNATNFRRSAILLDDPSGPSNSSSPRPPTMIERHVANNAPPSLPPASFPYEAPSSYNGDPYSVQYHAGQNQYSNMQYNGNPQYSVDAYGAPGVGVYNPALQGAYGAPATHTPHPQYPQQQYPQQYSFSPGQVIPSPRSSPPSSVGHHDLPNPFNPAAATTVSNSMSPARSVAETPVPSTRTGSPAESQTSSYLNRQPTQAGGAPPAYQHEPKYADMQRDVKVAPLTVMSPPPVNSGPSAPVGGSAPPTNANNAKRPMSTYTVYDPEDAYGGI